MRYLAIIVLIVIAGCSSHKSATTPVTIPKEESTYSWPRSNESDMLHYGVYGCFSEYCTDLKLIGTVPQTAVGVRPEFKLYLVGKVGTLALTARDIYGNESGFSPLTRFDKRKDR